MAKRNEGVETTKQIKNLVLDPVVGNFDAAHLREVHRRIFQNLPHHSPGQYRDDAPGHFKVRGLETNKDVTYYVPYARGKDIQKKLDTVLTPKLVDELKAIPDKQQFADRMAKLYGDLDHAHPFKEGNSRTLRAFTRQLAEAAGRELNWDHWANEKDGKTPSPKGRDLIYLARDAEVIKRHIPEMAHEGFKPRTVAELEMKSYVIDNEGKKFPTLARVVADSIVTLEKAREQAPPTKSQEQDLDR